jgi:hypothetical protein
VTFVLPTEIAEGRRNDQLTRYAGRLRRGGSDESAILAALLGVNASRCLPPLELRELRAIARSVSRYGSAREGYRHDRALALAVRGSGSIQRLSSSRFIVTGRRGGRFDVDLGADGRRPTCSCGRSMTPIGSSCTHTRAARIWVGTADPLGVG